MKNLLMIVVLFLGSCGESGNNRAAVTYSGTAMVLLDSSRSLEQGSDISLDKFIELEEGRTVEFHLVDGSSVRLTGTASGKLGDLLETDERIERLTKISIDMLTKADNDEHVLVVRSGADEAVWPPFSVPVPFKGNFCLLPDMPLKLYRPGNSINSLKFNLTSGGETISLNIQAGKNAEISWPRNLPLEGNFTMTNSGWFEKHIFTVVQLDKFDRVSLAKSSCSYHLDKINQVVH